jgi:hypothetical protein
MLYAFFWVIPWRLNFRRQEITQKKAYKICYAYCGNTAVDLDPLPVSFVRLTVVEPALFE